MPIKNKHHDKDILDNNEHCKGNKVHNQRASIQGVILFHQLYCASIEYSMAQLEIYHWLLLLSHPPISFLKSEHIFFLSWRRGRILAADPVMDDRLGTGNVKDIGCCFYFQCEIWHCVIICNWERKGAKKQRR